MLDCKLFCSVPVNYQKLPKQQLDPKIKKNVNLNVIKLIGCNLIFQGMGHLISAKYFIIKVTTEKVYKFNIPIS
jgi:hypothetical protein